MASRVVVFSSCSRFRGVAKRVRKVAEYSLNILKKDNNFLEIYLVTDAAIRSLNRRFRKRNKATNVLSFKYGPPFPEPRGGIFLGEVYLAPDYIRANCGDAGEFVLHGILHLLGYTHKRKRDTIEMEKKEKQILRILDSEF